MLSITAERSLKERGRTGAPLRIAVTGFGPFPEMPYNASQRLVEELSDMRLGAVPAPRLFTAALPTSWREGPLALRSFLAEARPHVILHFGVSSQAQGFVIETRAFNQTSARPDCAGVMPAGRCVRSSGRGVLGSSLPASRLVRRLRMERIPAELSADAGRYLCNAVLFESLALADAAAPSRAPRVGFIHIPPLPPPEAYDGEINGLSWASLRRGARIIIETLSTTGSAPSLAGRGPSRTR
jgi:pyroglutamyl-peptidase